ncbi:hypothetical protein CIK95_03810 [Prevotella sp. P5-108]|uniref:hypothetical protein n=1 Tax=Prevotella sp. P5-108 TaxID=2024225 RepID=UPI000B96F7DA|nr:hypothetical protein [Prevotella sp. P5-108]OYP65784.1 hypothetical protein CIK95_03810 [Prevotella sp. P5-108]
MLLKKSDTFVVTIEDLKGCSGELTLTYKSNNKNITSIKANDKPVTFTLNDKDRTAKITINEGTTSLKLEFSCKENTRLDNFKLVGNAAGESQKKTSLSFPGEGVTLINGKLANGDDFNGYTATEKDKVAGDIVYAASGDGVATVDKTTGEVTVDPNVSGTTKITATFTPNEEKTYAGSTASYTITNTKVYTSIADLKKDITTVKEKSFVLNLTNAIVTYTNRNSAFIQDESAGIFIYIKGGHKLEAGNTFTGTVNVKAMLFNDLAEITSWTSTVTPTQSEVPEPVVVTLAELKGDNYSKYESVRCKVVGVTVTKGMNVQDGEISQNGTIMPVRGGVQGLTMNESAILDMIGYPSIYDGIKQFQVWKNSDMTEHQTVKEITLYEDRDNTVEAAENVNVTLKRTLVGDGDWNTLCVPFSLTEAQTKAAFGADVELRELESVAGNTLTFKTVNSVTANVPCLIKVTAAGNEYKFEGVSTTAVKNNRDYTLSLVEGNILFLGIYSAMDVVEADLAGSSTNGYYAFLGANNTFFKAKAGSTMKAFRAFFSVPNDVNTKQLKAVIDGTTTGIEDLVIDGVKANGRVYNLNGQYVGNSLNGLQPGIYIQNGKKIVVK